MCVCIYIYIYIFTCICLYKCIYIYMYVWYIYIYTYTFSAIYTYVRVHIYIYIYMYILGRCNWQVKVQARCWPSGTWLVCMCMCMCICDMTDSYGARIVNVRHYYICDMTSVTRHFYTWHDAFLRATTYSYVRHGSNICEMTQSYE